MTQILETDIPHPDTAQPAPLPADPRRLRLAAWAGDVEMLETLLWHNGLDRAPDPAAQLAAVGEAVAASLEARAAAVTGALSDREIVEAGRDAMVATFDVSVHGVLRERFASVEHLDPRSSVPVAEGPEDDCPDTDPDDWDAVHRLEGRTPEELAAELRTAAGDCMAVAEVMARAGEPEAALRLARQSDAAAFEAYLVTAAALSGDDTLASVDVRWERARLLAADPDRDPVAARARLLELVGWAERDPLGRSFEPLPEV